MVGIPTMAKGQTCAVRRGPYRRRGAPLRMGAKVGRRPMTGAGVKQLPVRKYNARVRTEKKMHQSAKRRPGGSFSYFSYGGKFRPPIMRGVNKALAKHVKLLNNAGTQTGAVGTQSFLDVARMFTVTDMKDICDDIDSNQFRKIMFNSVKTTTLITNQDNGILRMKVYDIICRCDGSNTSYDSASEAWANGATALGNSQIPYVPGATPYGIPGFTSHYKVLKTTHVHLTPGEMHEHVTSFRPHKQLATNKLFTTGFDCIKGFTCFTMIVIQGGPANDTTNDNQVSTGKPKVDYVTTKEYRYTYLDKSVPTYQVYNSLPTAFTNGEEAMNIATGAAVGDDQA